MCQGVTCDVGFDICAVRWVKNQITLRACSGVVTADFYLVSLLCFRSIYNGIERSFCSKRELKRRRRSYGKKVTLVVRTRMTSNCTKMKNARA